VVSCLTSFKGSENVFLFILLLHICANWLLAQIVLTKRGSIVQRKKKKQSSFVCQRKRDPFCYSLFAEIENQKPIYFHNSFSTTAKGTYKERGPFFVPLHSLKIERGRNMDVQPLETKFSHTNIVTPSEINYIAIQLMIRLPVIFYKE